MTEKTPKEKTIATQYAELNRFAQNGEYERALKAANKILGVASQESLAFQSKIVCLIHLSKFEDAISILNKNPEFLPDLIFEKAYCYFRVNKHTEALSTIEKSEQEIDGRIKELKAQILYRLEEFGKSCEIYQDIIKNSGDEYEDERQANLSAAMVYLESDDSDQDYNDLKETTYELCYNKACLLINHRNYVEAEKKLKQCEKLCREVLEEDEATEEEIDIELALIRIQLAYVYQKQGRIKEAHQIYTSNLKLILDDVAAAAVASNNISCINKDQNLFDSKKKMKIALNDQLVYKLPSRQRKYITLNNAIFNYYINQPDQCEKACKVLEETWPELMTYSVVLRALNLMKSKNIASAIDLINSYQSKDPQENLYLKLSVAQMYLIVGKKVEACQVLENLGEDSFRPAIVGALTTLYLGTGEENTALKLFEKTVDFYKKNKSSSVDLSRLWKQAADFHIRNGHPKVAANSLEELLRGNSKDKKIVAQMVLACSQFDKPKALKLKKELPPVNELAKGVDIDSLQILTSNIINTNKKSPATKSDSQPGTPRSEDSKKRTRKSKKKGKLPKNYDPKCPVDPERWLPKYERTGYRKKRDRRAKDVIKGSQGTASGQAEQYDFSKYVEESTDSNSPAIDPSPRVGKGQHQNKKAQQKKKNKRR